jgi:saccharopine dehydrogenase-like NADP-dependent oxidoreductase
MPRRIVLIGATGFFGRRLTRRLAAIEGIELALTSRSDERASAVARDFQGAATITSLAFDRNDPAAAVRLAELAPWLVIDASGPFQAASYNLARIAIGLGAHWIDLADARDYLLGFGAALDATAREKGVVAHAGASSTPALSMAVVEVLARGWQRVDSIDIAIMPGGQGDVGEAVIRAILSYSGAPIETFAEGRPTKITGWSRDSLYLACRNGRRGLDAGTVRRDVARFVQRRA